MPGWTALSLGPGAKLNSARILGHLKDPGAHPWIFRFRQIQNLATLTLDRNRLSGTIPSGFSTFNRLRGVNLWGNRLSGKIPEDMGELANLNHIQLHDNALSGSIPDWITRMSRLTQLLFQITTFPGRSCGDRRTRIFEKTFARPQHADWSRAGRYRCSDKPGIA